MALARPVVAGMAAVAGAVVGYGEPCRREGGAQASFDLLRHVTGESLGHLAYIGWFGAKVTEWRVRARDRRNSTAGRKRAGPARIPAATRPPSSARPPGEGPISTGRATGAGSASTMSGRSTPATIISRA